MHAYYKEHGAGQQEREHICQEARDSRVWQARMKRPDPISALAVEPFLLQLWEMSWPRHPNSQHTAKLTASSESTLWHSHAHSRGEFSYIYFGRTFI